MIVDLSLTFLLLGFDSWWSKLKEYATQKKNFTSWEDFANPTDFEMILSDFLFSPYGFNYKSSFKFEDDLVCDEPAPRIKVRQFRHSQFMA